MQNASNLNIGVVLSGSGWKDGSEIHEAVLTLLHLDRAHAGIVMNEMVASVSIGKIDKSIVVDITKAEEDYHEGEGPTDIPFTLTSRGNMITHLQLDGKIQTSRLMEAYDAAVIACKKINDYQMRALKGEKINENE